jgi:hypothetical protein
VRGNEDRRAPEVDSVVGQRREFLEAVADRAFKKQHPASVGGRFLGEQLKLRDGECPPLSRCYDGPFNLKQRRVVAEVPCTGQSERCL